MAVSDDRKYTKAFVYNLLEGVKGKTLGEVDSSHQFARTQNNDKITGIAGDVIEQSVFGYKRDSKLNSYFVEIEYLFSLFNFPFTVAIPLHDAVLGYTHKRPISGVHKASFIGIPIPIMSRADSLSKK